jgi:hypothetical protein
MEEEKEEVGEGEGRLSGYNLKTTNRFISNTICYIDTLFFFYSIISNYNSLDTYRLPRGMAGK